MNPIIKTAAKIAEELSQTNERSDAKQNGIQHTKARMGEVLKNKWKNNVMHGPFIRNKDRQLISEEDTYLRLSKGDLKAETETEIVPAQGQAVQTKCYTTNVLNTETDSKSRLCQQFHETIDHVISACPILAKEQNIKRHDRVCAQLHFNICKETGVQLDIIHWFEHVPKSVETGQGCNVTILWNQQFQSDRTKPNNKPNCIIRNNEKKTCMLIDVAISGDRNVIKKGFEKILKYKDLTIEIKRMWNVKTKVIPVIIGATGTISKSLRKYVSNIPGNHEDKELQKTAILGTAHILRKMPT